MKCYIVDAFTNEVFKGNPAAVCILDSWLSETMMQLIAIENNLSETAFIVPNKKDYELRWFTPGGEIDLCGHATLASAYVLMNFVDCLHTTVTFQTKSGTLIVNKKKNLYEMDMPAYQLKPVQVTRMMEEAIGFPVSEAWLGRDLVCVLANEKQVQAAKPNQELVKNLDGLLLHITALGTNYDCVTRSFAPKLNVSEDPVCGSGHCHVVPLWANKLNKQKISAFQASKRTGVLFCKLDGKRVLIAGEAALYATLEIYLPAK